jgi:formylmethanofuran dehydrogenase subunit E
MDKTEALRSIQFDLFEYIQKKIWVDFDNSTQRPESFAFNGKNHVIDEVLCRFNAKTRHSVDSFLVSVTGGDVYLLYFNIVDEHPEENFQAGFWVLSFRVFNDNELMAFYREDRKMLINMTLNRVVNFHGHMCPELILGGKVCEYVHKLLDEDGKFKKGLSIIAENCTSALDAIQVLLGATIGNQRLRVIDYGKHNYTILYDKGQKGLRLSLKFSDYKDEDEYTKLVNKIAANQAGLNEVVQFQSLLDDRAKLLLSLPPEDIFDIEHTGTTDRPSEMADLYLSCCKCGQQVLKSRIINHQDKHYCMPCFQRINTGSSYYNLQ